MLPREEVIRVINHQRPERVPVYGWVRANLADPINEAFGSVEAFEDRYEFDLSHIFGGPTALDEAALRELRRELGRAPEPRELLQVPQTDPNQLDGYDKVREQVRHHKEIRGRFVYVQTPGIFEALNRAFGIQNHLTWLAMYAEDLRAVYRRQAEWNRAFAMNCLDLGVDMIHISDDWGAQESLMFRPETWWNLIYPNHKITCDAVKQRGAFLSLHSDGNIEQVLDGVVQLGFDVVHPYQESAGMNYQDYLDKYRDAFVLMGGLDVQTTIGFGKLDYLEQEIRRVLTLFADGGLIYCTTHFIQDHCGIEELKFAFDTIHQRSRSVCRRC